MYRGSARTNLIALSMFIANGVPAFEDMEGDISRYRKYVQSKRDY